MVQGEIDEKTAYIQARPSMARVMEVNGKARQAEGEAKVSNEKIHLDNARKLREIYFIDPEDTVKRIPLNTAIHEQMAT